MSSRDQATLLIKGGMVFDGHGNDPVRADIAISEDRVTTVGDLSHMEALSTIDATGMHVAPGFIDIHTHSDISIKFHAAQHSAIGMGVTTQVVGNCGLAPGFANDSDVFAFEKRWLVPHGETINWNSFAQHLQQVEDGGVGTNYVPLAGHGTLRKRVIGMENRKPDAAEMQQMCSILEGAMLAGAWGLSSGLEYLPGGYADVDELTILCKVAASNGGLYATHLRNEGDTLVESVEEAVEVARGANIPLQLSHHKAEGTNNWGKTIATLKLIERCREEGLDVQTDQYPYNAFMTGLSVQVLPFRAQSASPTDLRAMLTDPLLRSELKKEILMVHPEWADGSLHGPWSLLQIGVCRSAPQYQGKTISSLGAESGKHPLDWTLDLLLETSGFVSAVNFAIGDEDIERVLKFPFTSIGSDGVGTHPNGVGGQDQVHPRAYGTFARILGHYVRELKVLSESEAIRRMTSLPAVRFNLQDRGFLKPGAYADVVIYNPATIADVATFAAPHQFAEGIQTVVVNGNIAMQNGEFSDSLSGKVLRHG